MIKLLQNIGFFLSSTDRKALDAVNWDKKSVLKQCFLGFSILIPTAIAFISFRHIFSLVLDENSNYLFWASILAASVIFFIDTSTVFSLSITSEKKFIYFARIIYSMILGSFLAIVATISFNEDYLNNLYQNQLRQQENQKIAAIDSVTNTFYGSIQEGQVSGNFNSSDLIMIKLLQDDKDKIEEKIGTKHLDSGLFTQISYLYSEIFVRNNHQLGIGTLIFLLILISFDTFPILLKLILFPTKYDEYLKVNYYFSSRSRHYNLNGVVDDSLNDVKKELFELKPEEVNKKSLIRINKKLYYYNRIRLLADLFEDTSYNYQDKNHENYSKHPLFDEFETPLGDSESNKSETSKLLSFEWLTSIMGKSWFYILLTIPEFVILSIYTSRLELVNVLPYVVTLNLMFVFNRWAWNNLTSLKKILGINKS